MSHVHVNLGGNPVEIKVIPAKTALIPVKITFIPDFFT
jgi:hypothetical protein